MRSKCVNPGFSERTATKSAVWVISAGANGEIETPPTQAITAAPTASGDDIGIRIQ